MSWPTPLSGPPAAPTNITPVAGPHEARAIAPFTPLVLTWSQYFPSGGLSLYPPATHFVICFDAYVTTAAPACTVSNADWKETIAMPTAALVRSGNSFMFTPRTIDAPELERNMRLTLGACSSQTIFLPLVNSNCRFVGRDIYYSSKNIVAEGPGDSASDATTWIFDVNASNPGTSDIQQFSGTEEIFEVLFKGSPGRTCDTDVDGSSVRYDTTLIAIDAKGAPTLVTSLPRGADGRYSGSTPIVGVFRIGNFSDSRSFNNTRPLHAGDSPGTFVVRVTFPIARGAVQRPFVVVSTVDTGNAVREFNETDNKQAQCKVR